jgi:hypothetical protein
MGLIDFYKTANQVVSPLSGGRPHYQHRRRVTVVKSRKYVLHHGENPYTLAFKLFGDDRMYWLIADANPPKDPMRWEAGEVILIPEEIVENTFSTAYTF